MCESVCGRGEEDESEMFNLWGCSAVQYMQACQCVWAN